MLLNSTQTLILIHRKLSLSKIILVCCFIHLILHDKEIPITAHSRGQGSTGPAQVASVRKNEVKRQGVQSALILK